MKDSLSESERGEMAREISIHSHLPSHFPYLSSSLFLSLSLSHLHFLLSHPSLPLPESVLIPDPCHPLRRRCSHPQRPFPRASVSRRGAAPAGGALPVQHTVGVGAPEPAGGDDAKTYECSVQVLFVFPYLSIAQPFLSFFLICFIS